MMQGRIRARWTAGVAVALASALCVAGSPQSASAAAPATPSGLGASPAGSSTPILTWTPSKGATGYQVQVDDDPGFGSPEFTVSTTNFRATPLAALKTGTNRWRVRATSGSASSAWATSSFDVSPVLVPVPTSPSNGASLAQPASPPLLQWQGSPGAQSYTIEVDADQDFVGAKSYSTKTTSLVVPDPLGAGDWFWRVTAVKGAGLVSLPSGTMSFNVLALDKPQLTSPADSVTTKVGDVVLDWQPVPGARTYDVQVSDGPDFDPATTTFATGVQGTRFSPKTTLNNEQFWWRVRAVDLNGQATEWSSTLHGFERAWTDRPQPIHPLGSPSAPPTLDISRPYFQWTPVPKATLYELWVSGDPNFNTGDVCRVVGTTYAPRRSTDCGYLTSPSVTYWTVRPIDKPYNNHGLPGQNPSAVQAFKWSGPAPVGTFAGFAPVTGMKVSVEGNGAGCSAPDCSGVPANPVLTWDPQPGITSYEVWIGQDQAFTTSVLATRSVPIVTTNTMLTLEARVPSGATGDQVSVLPDSSAGQPYHWHVRPCVTPTDCGPHPVVFDVPTKSFAKVSPPVTGLVSSDRSGTEITFSWDEYLTSNQATTWLGEHGNQSAKGYHIQVDNEPSFQAPLLDDQVVDQTTYTALDRLYPEGTLYWRVQATDDEDNKLTWSAPATLIKESPAISLVSPASETSVSGLVPFRWDAQAFAASYTLEVYRNADRSFSAANRLFAATVKTPAYAWNQPIPADPSTYVWRVRRTDAEGNPGPWSATGSFRSLGAAPTLTSPSDGSRQPGNGLLFTWSDVPGATSYSFALQAASGTATKVSTVGNAVAMTKTLGTGTYSWSVTALDSAGNALGSSTTRSFSVDSTPPKVLKLSPKKIKPTTTLKVVFSEPVKGISKKSIKLKRKAAKSYKTVKASVKSAKGGKVALINPKGRLRKGEYKLVLSSSIKDAAGNALEKTTLKPKVG